jgi:hypothetical protein
MVTGLMVTVEVPLVEVTSVVVISVAADLPTTGKGEK